jgi:two-component system, LytTR family, sensor kinase
MFLITHRIEFKFVEMPNTFVLYNLKKTIIMKNSIITILHTGYWACYSLLVAFVSAIMTGLFNHFIFQGYNMIAFEATFIFVPAIISFYVNYSYLFEKYFKQNKILKLSIATIFIALICGIIGLICTALIWKFIIPKGGPSMHEDGYSELLALVFVTSINAFFNGLIGLLLKGFITSSNDIEIKKELHIKNKEMELALIKAKLNPHFLFNTINNIDALINIDAAKASLYLNKFSEILRYMLYETDAPKIALQKEINNIEKYIDLQKIRSVNPNFVKFTNQISNNNLMIAPMILMPIVENAFKHCSNTNEENAIEIKIESASEVINFYCKNKFSINKNQNINGLGKSLIEKRIALLYPNKYELKTSIENNIYSVHLCINTNEY